MAINFNQNSTFNLKPINKESVRGEVMGLLVNGEENLLNGQPYENADGVFIVEINAVISYIEGVSAWYDDKINVFRIEW